MMSQMAPLKTVPFIKHLIPLPYFSTAPASPSIDDYFSDLIGRSSGGQAITIDILPDDVLLEIFDFYVDQVREIEAWQLLAHVCRRWRNLLFGSPRRLNLQLVCTPRTPASTTLAVWPVLPLVIQGHISPTSGVDNTVVALRFISRVCKIDLWGISGSELEEVLAAMQQPFPEITHLRLGAYDAPIVPNSFLGGSAPRLQYLHLERIPFPGLPKLLSSATHLVELHLHLIPQSGYLSPEVMVTYLSALTSLKRLSLGFQSPQSYPNGNSPPPPRTRAILPTLTYFQFRGVSEYLDGFVARIDAPRLSNLHIIFFNQVDFDTPQLAQFIGRTPSLNVPDEAHVIFHHDMVVIRFLSQAFGHAELHVEISCSEPDWQLSSVAQVCALCLPPLSTIEILYIEHPLCPNGWENGFEDREAQWLNLFRPFNGAKSLHLPRIFAPFVGSSLKELKGDRVTEVLPTLQYILVDGLPDFWLQEYREIEGIKQFVDRRLFSDHPITISVKDSPLKLDWFKAEHVRACIPPFSRPIPRASVVGGKLPLPSNREGVKKWLRAKGLFQSSQASSPGLQQPVSAPVVISEPSTERSAKIVVNPVSAQIDRAHSVNARVGVDPGMSGAAVDNSGWLGGRLPLHPNREGVKTWLRVKKGLFQSPQASSPSLQQPVSAPVVISEPSTERSAGLVGEPVSAQMLCP